MPSKTLTVGSISIVKVKCIALSTTWIDYVQFFIFQNKCCFNYLKCIKCIRIYHHSIIP